MHGVFMDDKELIGMFLRREEAAVAEAERTYGELCHWVAMNVLRDEEYARECVNDALLKAWEAIPREKPENLGGYLVVLTRNTALNRYEEIHALKRGGAYSDRPVHEIHNLASRVGLPEDELMYKELKRSVNEFLRALPPDKRRIFVSRVFLLMRESEISEAYGVKTSTVRSTLLRIRKKLRIYLRNEGYDV